MDEQINTNEPLENSSNIESSINSYGIDNQIINQLASRMKIVMAIVIGSIVVSVITTIITLTQFSRYDMGYSRYSSSMSGISSITTIIGFLIGLAISIAFIIYLNKSSKAFNSFSQTGDIRDLNDGFYHQNRYFNLTKALIVIALTLGGVYLIISLISMFSR